jgi:hypothetical protein
VVRKLDSILVYHWQAWKHFFISGLVTNSCHVTARYEDGFQDLARHLTPNIRAVLFQVNLSYSEGFPANRARIAAALRRRKILVLNSEVQDISKRHLHRMLTRAGLRSTLALKSGPADETLFVKTNLNSGGVMERRYLPRPLRKAFLPKKRCPIRNWDDYYAVKRRDVAPSLWSNDSVVIERYVDNHDNTFFRVYAFGDAIIVVQGQTKQLIKKLMGRRNETSQFYTRGELLSGKTALSADLQHLLQRFITCYPLAYFCIDIVHDGTAHYVVDLNLTPYADPKRQTAETRTFLCEGAERYLQSAASAAWGGA